MQLCEKSFPDDNSTFPGPIAFKFDMVIDNTKAKCPIVLEENAIEFKQKKILIASQEYGGRCRPTSCLVFFWRGGGLWGVRL